MGGNGVHALVLGPHQSATASQSIAEPVGAPALPKAEP